MILLTVALIKCVSISAAPYRDSVTSPGREIRSVHQTIARFDSADLARFIDPLIDAQMKKENIPGAVFILVQAGKVVYERGYGFANVANGTRVDPEKTIWRIGSISKVFTATAVVQLADRGRFKLSDDVNRYLTDIKVPATYPQPVTFQHLLTHTAGFDEIRPGTRADTRAELLPLGKFLTGKLVRLRPPGEVISYSTYGVTLAGHIVEQVSGLDFETYLTRNIFRPLGMLRTNIDVPDSLKKDLAQGYEWDNGANQLGSWEWYHTTPASSINATAADMGRFIIAHLQNGRLGNARIMSEAAARDMHSRHMASHPELAGFAYGFQESFVNGERLLQHGGNVEGFAAQMAMIPARGMGWFIASQHEPAQLKDVIQQALIDHYYPDKSPPKPAVPMAGYQTRAQRFVGTYELNQFCHTCGADRRVYFRSEVKANPDGTLTVTGQPQPFVEVSPLFFRGVNGRGAMAFREDSTGKIVQVAGDSWIVLERIK